MPTKLFPTTPTGDFTQNLNTGNINTQGILDVLRTQLPSLSETTFPSIIPLLTPGEGLTPETQEAIGNIQSLGQEGIRRSIGNVGTAAQRRGLTGSSIEAGAIGEASRAGEQDILRQINPLIAGEAQRKQDMKINLANFMASTLGIDFETNRDLLNNIAQIMADELGRETSLDIAGQTSAATEKSGLYQGIGNLISGLAPLALSDKRLKRDIKKVGMLENGLNVYSFKYIWEDTTRIGLIAQEVKEKNPDAVFEVNGYLAVDYSKAVL